jgi:hypothetical protein
MRKKKLTDVNVDVSDSVESQLRREIRFQTSQNQLQSYNIQHRSQQYRDRRVRFRTKFDVRS